MIKLKYKLSYTKLFIYDEEKLNILCMSNSLFTFDENRSLTHAS